MYSLLRVSLYWYDNNDVDDNKNDDNDNPNDDNDDDNENDDNYNDDNDNNENVCNDNAYYDNNNDIEIYIFIRSKKNTWGIHNLYGLFSCSSRSNPIAHKPGITMIAQILKNTITGMMLMIILQMCVL